MKVVLDTNIYISWIRNEKYAELLLDSYTLKHLSAVVLMELWAGARTKKASRIIEKIQRPYLKTKRLITLSVKDYIRAGEILSDLPDKDKSRIKSSGFINDIFIALNTLSIGAVLFTDNKKDFKFISGYLKKLKVNYL